MQIHFIDAKGVQKTVPFEDGQTLMEAAVKAGIRDILAECGGACSCATCHVYVDAKWKDATGDASTMEEDMLDFASDVRANSRLSCQITLTPEMDGLTVTTPARQG